MIIRAGEARNYKTNYTTSDYYVAYLDFLGTKENLSTNSDNYLNDLVLIYEDTIDYLKKRLSTNIF